MISIELECLIYVSNRTHDNNIQEFWFSMKDRELIQFDNTMLLAKHYIVFNFRNADEKQLITKEIPTISAQTLMSIAGGCSYRIEDMDFLFMRGAKVRYSEIFGEEQKTDHSLVFHSNRFWGRIACIIQECIDLIYRQGLQCFLLLEIKVIPVLHTMFDTPYPVDSKRAIEIYKKLKQELTLLQKQISFKNLGKTATGKKSSNDKEVQNLIAQRNKLENKLMRFPKELSGIRKEKAYIFSKFRSIGTDTFRISTYSANIQGFPKELRQCLLPRQGNKLIEYDIVCSQLMLLAGLAEEDSLIQCYLRDMDLYTFISSEILEKSKDEIFAKERGIYKTIILQTLYGAGVDTIQKEVQGIGCRMNNDKIREFNRQFYRLFPAIRKYIERVKTVEEITLPTGRKYCMKNIAPYARLSYILQYIEAETLRKILIALSEKSVEMKFGIYLCIHDSIFIETSNEDIAGLREFILKCFNKAVSEYFKNIKKINIKETIFYEES